MKVPGRGGAQPDPAGPGEPDVAGPGDPDPVSPRDPDPVGRGEPYLADRGEPYLADRGEPYLADRGEPGPVSSGSHGPAAGPGRPRRGLVLAIVTLAGLCCLVAAVVAGTSAIAGETQTPTPAERSAAAAVAVAERWRAWPAGRVFPAALGYTTTLADRETARRVGISPDDRCAAALDAALARQARRDGCQAALRASYVDQLDGIVYTTGLLAFPSPGQARTFARRVPPNQPPVAGLRALALPGTASEMFDDAARQVATVRQAGPYVLLTVAGYADGRPAAATGEYDAAAFRPASQLAGQILAPLARPAVVNCASRQWAC